MLTQAKAQLQQVAGPVEVKTEENSAVVKAVLEAADGAVALQVAWDKEYRYVAGRIHAPAADAENVVEICSALGDRLQCGSVFLPQAPPAADLFELGYAKQYILPLLAPAGRTIDYVKLDRRAAALAKRWERLLQTTVSLHNPAADHRPYIFSLDWEGDYDGCRFSCYFHVHPLSRAAYLEELTVPAGLRGRGIGAGIAADLRWLAAGAGCRYLYLHAKHGAEAFWESQGFRTVYRANLRRQRRRTRALRRRPGWDQTWVEGERLPEPHWVYRNHPQDDMDLHSALQAEPIRGAVLL